MDGLIDVAVVKEGHTGTEFCRNTKTSISTPLTRNGWMAGW